MGIDVPSPWTITSLALVPLGSARYRSRSSLSGRLARIATDVAEVAGQISRPLLISKMPAEVSARRPRQEIPRIPFGSRALSGHGSVEPAENLKIRVPPPTRFSAAKSAFVATSIFAIGH